MVRQVVGKRTSYRPKMALCSRPPLNIFGRAGYLAGRILSFGSGHCLKFTLSGDHSVGI